MKDIKDRARKYLAEHSKYSEVFRQTFIAVDTLTAMVEFAEQETKELRDELNYAETHCLFHSDCSTQKENTELKDEVKKLKLLVSSLVYEINQIWDINEMNDDLRRCAEKIDREVQLSKMAEDNRMVISALGFAIVPPNPKLDVKEV